MRYFSRSEATRPEIGGKSQPRGTERACLVGNENHESLPLILRLKSGRIGSFLWPWAGGARVLKRGGASRTPDSQSCVLMLSAPEKFWPLGLPSWREHHSPELFGSASPVIFLFLSFVSVSFCCLYPSLRNVSCGPPIYTAHIARCQCATSGRNDRD